jgi:hypothetical protein
VRASCLALVGALLVACGGSGVGVACDDATPCAMSLVCAATDDPAVRVCMRTCETVPDGGITRLCSDGSACVGADGSRVCYIGGHTPFGASCMDMGMAPASSLRCEPGTICSELGICEQACTHGDDAPCDDDEVCADAAGGVCRRLVHAECSPRHVCTTGLMCTSELGICEEVCTVGNDATCEPTEVCADVEGGVCRGTVGGPCSASQPCALDLECTVSGDMNLCAARPEP